MIQAIRLRDAWLCANCSCIGENGARCPACGGRPLLSLSQALNRAGDDVDLGVQDMHNEKA